MKHLHKLKKFRRLGPPILVAVLVVLALAWLYPTPEISPHMAARHTAAPTDADLVWPAYGQAALGIQGHGVVETHGQQAAAPMASIAKVFTALAVLNKKPLSGGQTGPTLTLNSNDVAIYNNYYALGGSLVAVADGEQISERQALSALLLPSANNMADTLAIWAFGSTDKYTAYANQYAASIGLNNTHISDASGFSHDTLSSAADLVKIGQVVMRNPVLADIVSQPRADLPVAGVVNNTNWLLGIEGIRGIKTGNTEEAGGCFLFAANRQINGKNILIIGSVMSGPSLTTALTDSRTLLHSVDTAFKTAKVVDKQQSLGYYSLPWGGQVNILPQSGLQLTSWRGQHIIQSYDVSDTKTGAKKDAIVGKLAASSGIEQKTVNLVLQSDIPKPPLKWRIFQRYL